MASSSELRRATEQLKQMRQVLNSATTIPEHEQRLTALEGPRLDAADRSLPLPLLRSRIAALLDQAASRLERARSAAPPTSPWALLGEIARTSVACLALAVAYVGLAWRPGRELSLLEGAADQLGAFALSQGCDERALRPHRRRCGRPAPDRWGGGW